jgi:hypothetical protein
MMAEGRDVLPGIGGKVGGKIAGLTAQAVVQARRAMAPHQKQLAQSIMGDLFKLMDDEAAKAVGPFLQSLVDSPDTPDSLRPALTALAQPAGQWEMFVAGSTTGALMSGGLGELLANEMAPAVLPLIAKTPNLPLSAADAASAQARGIDIGLPPSAEAARSGINGDRFDGLVQLQRAVPAVEQILTMLNRGAISDSHADILLRRLGYDINDSGPLKTLRRAELSPEQLAALVNFGVMDEETARPVAAHSGLSTEDFHRLVLGGGQPPSITDVLFAWRRGIITEADVDRAIVQSPIRREWTDAVKSLQWQPLPVSEAANAVNQGHMSQAQADQAAKENGFKPDDFKVIVDNAGIPPGPQEALDWVNAGWITEAEFRTIFLESRIKNKYIDLYLRSRQYILPPDTIRLLYSRGAFTKEQATAKLLQRGLSTEDAAAYIDGATAERSQPTRDLTKSEIVNLYQVREWDFATAHDALTSLGYDENEAAMLLDLADLARIRTFQNAALNHLHAAYLSGRSTVDDATTTMDALGIAAGQRNDILILWNLERGTPSKALTPADIANAVKKGLLDQTQALDRLVGQGYSADDATIYLQLRGAFEEGP